MNRQQRRNHFREQSRVAAELRKATAQRLDSPEAVLAASRRLFEIGRISDALPGLRQACAHNPADLPLRAALAYALASTGEVDAAVSEYRAMLRLEPNSATLLTNLAVLLIGRADDEAVQLLYRAAEAAPEHAATAFTLAELLDRQKRRVEAFHQYRRAVALFRRQIGPRPGPSRCNDLVKLGTALSRTGEVAAALATFDRAIAIRPDHPLALARRGLALARLRRVPEAIESLRLAAAAEPDNAWLRRAIGDLFLEVGETRAAQLAFQAALKINPRDALANYFLAAARKSQGVETAPAAYVQQLFDEYAEKFDTDLVEMLRYRAPGLLSEAVLQVARPSAGAWTVIDLGCGTGLCGPLIRPYAKTLIGVDLSAGMLAKARERAVYDDLLQDDLAAALGRFESTIDLAISADVLIYLGSLTRVFAAASRALCPGGWFAFTTEVHEGDGFVLDSTKRYRHSRAYLDAEAATHGFGVAHAETIVARQEHGSPVREHLLILRRPA